MFLFTAVLFGYYIASEEVHNGAMWAAWTATTVIMFVIILAINCTVCI